MPKLLQLIYAHEDNYEFPTEFDDTNIEAEGLYEFGDNDEWNAINDMTV